MTKNIMTSKRFEDITLAYGANPDLWPEDERVMAIEYATSLKGETLQTKIAKELDLSLSFLPDPAPASESYLERLLDIPKTQTPQHSKHRIHAGNTETSSGGFLSGTLAGIFPGLRVPLLAGLFTACLLGIVLGVSNVARYNVNIQTVDASAFIYSSPSIIADMKEFH